MKRAFATLDVFTDTPLHGNPLAVVLDAEGLDTARMQAVAREFNLSETVFVLPARDPVNTARLRIFTPARELPFAGHPTVGTAVLLAGRRAPEIVARQDLLVVLEEEVGPVSCTVRRHKGVTRASFAVPRLPAVTGEAPPPAVLAAALGLETNDIGFEGHRPCLASAGVPFTFVPLATRDALARAALRPDRWAAAGGPGGVYLYTHETVLPGSDIQARMFAPAFGMGEDPATGAAAAALAAVLPAFEPFDDGDHTLQVAQGVEMGRPSLITLGLETSGGALTGATVGGAAVLVSEGHIHC